MVNKVTLIGYLGQDPELKQVASTDLCKFSMATSESYKDKAGAKQTKTQWHNITVWGKLAEVCSKWLKKGSKIYLEGKIEYNEYEKVEIKMKATNIIATEIKFMDSAPTGSAAERPSVEAPAGTDSDLPF